MLPTKEEPRRPGYFNTCVSIHVYKKLVMGMYMLAAGNSTCVFPFFVLDLRGWDGRGGGKYAHPRTLPKTQSVEYWKIGRYCNCFHVRIHLAPILLHTLPRRFVRDCLQSQSCVLATNAPKSSKHPQESWAKISATSSSKDREKTGIAKQHFLMEHLSMDLWKGKHLNVFHSWAQEETRQNKTWVTETF